MNHFVPKIKGLLLLAIFFTLPATAAQFKRVERLRTRACKTFLARAFPYHYEYPSLWKTFDEPFSGSVVELMVISPTSQILSGRRNLGFPLFSDNSTRAVEMKNLVTNESWRGFEEVSITAIILSQTGERMVLHPVIYPFGRGAPFSSRYLNRGRYSLIVVSRNLSEIANFPVQPSYYQPVEKLSADMVLLAEIRNPWIPSELSEYIAEKKAILELP